MTEGEFSPLDKLIDIRSYPVTEVLDTLLQDKSTKKNIIWATDTYEDEGQGFTDKEQIFGTALLLHSDIIRPRIQKSQEEQAQRTRKKAEVFTPAWLCNRMNNHLDEDWFGRTGVFNTENEDHTWTVAEDKVEFSKGKTWQQYVDSRRLEITCGEAPYLVSRYDVSVGELIVPPLRRIGILDRKLRIVGENTDSFEDWLKWTYRAYEACYGYEYQGDNVLIARINLLMTFVDYFEERWQKKPDSKQLKQAANIIAWNIWQMDGLKDTVPLGKPFEEYKQLSLFDIEEENENEPDAVPCRIFNWRSKSSVKFMNIKELNAMGSKLFDYVIGNPPYQDETLGDNKGFAPPVYNLFLDSAYKIADKVEMIHPARFLFNAGSTPKAWNEAMLNDTHLKVLNYEEDASKLFPNTDIKGGVTITYHDEASNFGSIGIFTPYEALNNLLKKVTFALSNGTLSDIGVSGYSYHFTEIMHDDHPEAKALQSKGHEYDLKSNIIEKLTTVFLDRIPNDDFQYSMIIGRANNERVTKYIRRNYLNDVINFNKYKLLIPKASGIGAFGEVLGPSIVVGPNTGHTETFFSIGKFETENEANNLYRYLKGKFARALLSVSKKTQMITPRNFIYVPLQDFTENSDIDWSKSIHEIDLQLYRKYGLDEKEIEFIETHVKEMV